MLILWRSTDKRLVSHAVSAYSNESESTLFIHERHISDHRTGETGTGLEKILPNVPDDLLGDILPVIGAQPDDSLMRMIIDRSKTFETHSDVIAYYMGDNPSDDDFELTKDRWIGGLHECIKHYIKRREVKLFILHGLSPDPLPFYLANILSALGVDAIRMYMIYNRPIGDEMLPTNRVLPVLNSSLNLLNPETFILLMFHFFAHPSVYPYYQHPTLNVSRLTTKVLSLDFSQYMPPHRGLSRSFEGIKKSLKNISFDLEREGLLEREIGGEHNFRLTPLGHLYAKVTFGIYNRIKEILSEDQKGESALIQILENFDELKKLVV